MLFWSKRSKRQLSLVWTGHLSLERQCECSIILRILGDFKQPVLNINIFYIKCLVLIAFVCNTKSFAIAILVFLFFLVTVLCQTGKSYLQISLQLLL